MEENVEDKEHCWLPYDEDHLSRVENEDDYLKGEIEDNEIAIDGLHGEMEASKDLESCLIEATICKEEPWEFLIMNE